jgi:Raf kinase inhibitor-like YbhB/YbcL family protein
MIKYMGAIIIILTAINLGGTMKLTSPAFDHNKAIPAQYTCEGADISPALQWSDAPKGTKSFALIVDDPDAPSKVWVHWILFNIPASVNELTENMPSNSFVPYSAQGFEGPRQGATDFNGAQHYGGPCPPSGNHRYHFTLYALDTTLDLPAGATKRQLLAAMKSHILEETTLIGTYQHK